MDDDVMVEMHSTPSSAFQNTLFVFAHHAQFHVLGVFRAKKRKVVCILKHGHHLLYVGNQVCFLLMGRHPREQS
jgi:hypothetical protein